jgi:hypothetical protein
MKKTYDIEEIKEVKKEAEYDSITGYLEKTKRIKKEVGRLNKLFSNTDENKNKLVSTTIEDIAFMTITMQDLRESIIRSGTTVEYNNGGGQSGTKQSPDAQLYLQFSQKQTQAMKILTDCMPKPDKPIPKDDGFDNFVGDRDD